MNKGISIAILDDDASLIDALIVFLGEKYYVKGFTSSRECIEKLQKESFDLLILDYFIDDLNGKDVIEEIRTISSDIYIMLLTGYSEEVPGIRSLNELDIQGYIEKGDMKKTIVYIETIIKSIEFFKGSNISINKKIGQRIKALRKLNNLSQDDVAKFIEVKTNSVSQYESGAVLPTVTTILKLAKLFNVTTDYILCYTLNISKLYTR